MGGFLVLCLHCTIVPSTHIKDLCIFYAYHHHRTIFWLFISLCDRLMSDSFVILPMRPIYSISFILFVQFVLNVLNLFNLKLGNYMQFIFNLINRVFENGLIDHQYYISYTWIRLSIQITITGCYSERSAD